MALLPGTRLGPYEVIGPLGSGGMGEVHRARDPRLGREVAIKVLPAERLSDPVRRARFVQEARSASALNHPHIVTIYEIESAEGVDFIVMELVAGKTLDALIPRHGMRIGEVLRIAIPLADALAAAHGHGIVHRDLKPANVMVTPEGVVKILDFGLAKLTQAEGGGGEDDTTLDAQVELSRPGTVAGTPAYMSPEQASGGVVDARSDVFSFGAVIYEMVTGRRPFGGGSTAEMLAALLKEQPKPPSEIVADVPKELERIVLRCLRKEPERRFQHMLDVKVELEEVKEESDSQAKAPAGFVSVVRRRRQRIALVTSVVVIVAAAAAGTLWRLRRPELPPPSLVPLTSERYAEGGSFSPDGTQIAYASAGDDGDNWDICLKIVGETEARRLTIDPARENRPAWSPDGMQIAFLRYSSGPPPTSSIHLVSPLGGPARRLSDFPADGQLSWSADGRWLAARKARSGTDAPGGIFLVSVASGEARAVTLPKAPAFDVSPAFSPDGQALAYARCEGVEATAGCDVFVLAVDPHLRPRGTARRLTWQGLFIAGGLAWTRDAHSIVYGGDFFLWRVRADGGAPPERLELIGRGVSQVSTAVHRDRLAFIRETSEPDLFRLQLNGSLVPLLASALREVFPQYSPDGRRIAFERGRGFPTNEIWLVDADGSNPMRLTHGPGRHQGTPRWSPDGGSIAFDSLPADGRADIWTIGVDGSGLRQITHHPSDDFLPRWSRDGRFIYFTSNRTGRNEIWRAPAAGGTEEQVTREGGSCPDVSFDGRTLYYRRDDGTLLARPATEGEERTILPCVGNTQWSVGPRGVFHLDCLTPDAGPERTMRYWDASTGRDRAVATFEACAVGGLSVSPDGRSLVFGRSSCTSDLMMIENFR